MSEMAKKAREALKSKARKLAGEATGKVDASSFTPSEPLNADVKTGMRPVSKRAFKKGGKVHGKAAMKRADRVQRKSGGKVESEAAEAKEYADAKTNRNLKDANAKREGKKHVGGLKTGGRAKRANGGMTPDELREAYRKGKERADAMTEEERRREAMQQVDSLQNHKRLDEMGRKSGGRAKKQDGGNAGQLNRMTDEDYRRRLEAAQNPPASTPAKPKAETSKPMDTSTMSAEEAAEFMRSRKSGGRAKKLGGGAAGLGMAGGILPALIVGMPDDDEDKKKTEGRKSGGRAKKQMGGQLQRIGAANAGTAGPDTNLVPSSVLNFKPAGRGFIGMMKKGGRVSKEEWEHSKADLEQDRKLAKKHGMSMDKWEKSKLDEKHDSQQSPKGLRSGGRRVAKKDGGCTTGYAMGGYAEGGSTKKGKSKKDGKTHINIMIDAGGPRDQAPAPVGGPPPLPPSLPPGMPPMPPAMPPGPPPMPPGGMPPAGFKDGGHVYPAMKYGAGSGEGRLEKMEKYGANARR